MGLLDSPFGALIAGFVAADILMLPLKKWLEKNFKIIVAEQTGTVTSIL
ncbi:MAG: hypothetical protein ACLU5B_00660 [Mediterraneibacter faecis]